MFENLKNWLNGKFECIKCHKSFFLMCFGTGKTICPDCYNGEAKWLFPDEEILVNRVWGLIAFKDMSGDQLVQFIEELSDASIALSLAGFEVIYKLAEAPEQPIISIRSFR